MLEATNLAYVLKPFYTNKNKEIISSPKVYGFDTGFVCYFKGWDNLRSEDYGYLWEHLVLNELIARDFRPQYWRDKQKHEIDFIFNRKNEIVTIECKWKDTGFKPNSLEIFRSKYKKGRNIVVSANITKAYKRKIGDLEIHFSPLDDLADLIS
ncbi:MAG: hypothetical protein A2Z20_08065 [Bdellovibrionales bacterium RBG_16_40_8]|nr:MAG: hypothetical protein A2Z20_08065 [Bdellovibrionales bacterium RBG_16_40_8]